MIKLENTIISLKDHQKDINNKLANAVTKLKKQIGLVEANAINKIDSITYDNDVHHAALSNHPLAFRCRH